MQVYDVIIVGVGAAGAAALNRLFQEDPSLRVLALEANDHLGGRINTHSFGDNVVDLGAQWCHGEKNNAVYGLVKELDLLGRPGKQLQVFCTSNGQILPTATTNQYYELCCKVLDTAKRQPNLTASQPIGDFIKTEYNKQLALVDFPVDLEIAEEIVEWFLKNIQAKLSTNELVEKSLNSVKEAWESEGDMWLNWKDKGFKTLIHILLKKFPEPSEALPVEILMNKEVLNVRWKGEASDKDSGRVQLTCRDGSVFSARHVILTLPLGVMKERYESMFTPSLPDQKIMAIRGVAVCTMNKIYMRFAHPWWAAAGADSSRPVQFELLWRPQDKEQFSGEDSWLREVYALSTVANQRNVLCGWVTGTAAEDMELLTTHEVQEAMYRLLKRVFASEHDVPQPIEILRSTWYSNTMARGSFSYRSVETECLGLGAEELSQPLEAGGPKVCFAGEATSLHHHGTVHGAVESGYREADRLIQHLKS